MRKRFGVVVAVLVTTSCVWASGASAATEVGSNCVANTATGPLPTTIVQTAQAPGSPFPLAVPSAGVITKWRVSLITGPYSIPEQLKVFHPAAPKQFQVVGESAFGIVHAGTNLFDTRIPVQAGDLLGLFGNSTEFGTLFCQTENPGDTVAAIAGNPAVGSTATAAEEEKELGGAVSAVVEPDADKDGYGDETQDKCPQSAAVQAIACPTLLLDAVVGAAGKSSVTILVATTTAAPIAVTATVKLPGGSKKERVSAQATIKAPQTTVTPPKISAFKLKFPKKVKSELAAMPKSKSLKLKVTAQGTNVAGVVSSDKLTVKLKGQG